MIDKSKTYTTRDGREVRIYATGQASPYHVHGAVKKGEASWIPQSWTDTGQPTGYLAVLGLTLVEADPHGILPRHRELLAEALTEKKCLNGANEVRNCVFEGIAAHTQAALIALAKLDEQHKGGAA